MENVKEGCGGAKSSNEENPNNTNTNNINNSSIEDDSLQPISRTPFTNLSQVDADLALARTLQEQGSSDLGSSEAGSFLQEDEEEDGYDDDDSNEDDDDVIGTDADEDAFDAHRSLEEEEDEVNSSISEEVEIDPSAFDNDEAFARALQDAEERELAARLMALTGGSDWTADETENDNNSQ
ncbi:E3 ubiquitin ligase big brother-related, partial [Thalictrum thalictroides]